MLEKDKDELIKRNIHLMQHFNGATVLITGATGFFGMWLCHFFHEAKMRGLIDTKVYVTSTRKTLLNEWFYVLNIDLTQLTPWHLDVEFDYCFHLAVARGYNPIANYLDNTEMMSRLLGITNRRIRKMLFTSSGAVYKPSNTSSMHESAIIGVPPIIDSLKNSYRASKMACESLIKQEIDSGNSCEFVITRPFTFYGPFMEGDYAITKFVEWAYIGEPIMVMNPGTIRSYMYPVDLVNWLLTAMVQGRNGEIFNVGSDEGITIHHLARAIADVFGSTVEVRTPVDKDSVYVPVINKASKLLGLRQHISLVDGLMRWRQYYKGDYKNTWT